MLDTVIAIPHSIWQKGSIFIPEDNCPYGEHRQAFAGDVSFIVPTDKITLLYKGISKMKRYVQKNRIISLVTARVLACGMMFSMSVSADDELPLTGGAAAVTGQAKGVGYAAKLYNS